MCTRERGKESHAKMLLCVNGISGVLLFGMFVQIIIWSVIVINKKNTENINISGFKNDE